MNSSKDSSKDSSKTSSNQTLFREEAIERLASPDQLDQLVQDVSLRTWLPLGAIALIAVAAILWSVLGRIPLTVTGQGVLIRPRRVVQLQTPSSGRLISLSVKPGDEIKKGEVLGTIDQAELQQQLQQEQEKLDRLVKENQQTSSLRSRQSGLQRTLLREQQELLESNLRNTTALSPTLQRNGLVAIQSNRENLQLRIAQIKEVLPRLQRRADNYRKLLEAGAVSEDTQSSVQQEYLDNILQLSDLETQYSQLDVKESELKMQFLEQQNSIERNRNQLKEITNQEVDLAKQELEQSFNERNQIEDQKRKIEQLALQLSSEGKITSPYDGQMLEVAIVPGQVISPSAAIGSVQVEDTSGDLMYLAFLSDQDGKQVRPDMTAQVTPSFVKRERFGGITGKVTEVSPFPATTQSIQSLVGSAELANRLGANTAPVQITISLDRDPSTVSGFKWSSSRGPIDTVSSGTTGTVQIRVGEVAPISYLIPLFRSWTGVY